MNNKGVNVFRGTQEVYGRRAGAAAPKHDWVIIAANWSLMLFGHKPYTLPSG